MVRTQFGDTTNFTVHSDDAPTVYITGNPGHDRSDDSHSSSVRRGQAQLARTRTRTRSRTTSWSRWRTQTEMKTLHMVTSDPVRTPTFTPFADPGLVLLRDRRGNCATPAECAFIPPRSSQSFAWNHGDIQDEIASTWVGMVGPGRQDGIPTASTLDRSHRRSADDADAARSEGRLPATMEGVVERTSTGPCRRSCGQHKKTLLRLGAVYKQVKASFGSFAMDTLVASTQGDCERLFDRRRHVHDRSKGRSRI